MLLRILRKLPVIQSLTSFQKECHVDAIKKFAVLWVLSVLPILFAALTIASREQNLIAGFWQFVNIVNGAFAATEPFIYAASFMSPMLYLIYEKYREQREYISAKRKSPERLSAEPTGFVLTLLITLLVFLFSAYTYGVAKGSGGSPSGVESEPFTGIARLVYAFAMFCWYFIILDSIDREPDFVKENRQHERNMRSGFADRVRRQRS